MPAHRYVSRLLRATLALLLVLAGPARADSCGDPATASTHSLTTTGLAGMAFSFEQNAHLQRLSDGDGFDGDWIVTEWTVVTTLPMADPLFAQRGGMLPVPEWNATCTGKMLNPTQGLSECVGEVPLVVENGAIAWVRGGAPIGKITPATSALPAEMTLNILPDEGGFDWTMTGAVVASKRPSLSGALTAMRVMSDTNGMPVGREYTLQVSVDPALQRYIDGIDAGVSKKPGASGALIVPSKTTPVGRTYLVRVYGHSPNSRKAVVDASTIDVSLNAGGCHVSVHWALSGLLFAANYAP